MKIPQLDRPSGLWDAGSPAASTTSVPQGLFPLVSNLLVGLFRLEIDHMHFLRPFFTTPVDDYWQVLGLGREG